MTSAGKYRERFAFDFRAASTDDGYGNEQAGDWTEAFTVHAEVKPLRGGEIIQAARLAGKQPILVTVRQSSDTVRITPDWRTRDVRTGVIYNIRSKVDPRGDRADFDMECEAGVAV
jgi:SPP1 family predicted phage head-tail adaptor